MKKLFLAIAMMFGALAATSCKDTVAVVYSINVEGSANGDVVVTFPNGNLELNEQTGLLFTYSNDTAPLTKAAVKGVAVEEAAESDQKEVRSLAETIESGFAVTFKDAAAGGEYHVKIHGYAKEPTTGITILIDKSFDYPAPVDQK